MTESNHKAYLEMKRWGFHLSSPGGFGKQCGSMYIKHSRESQIEAVIWSITITDYIK
jgi:hypothetical protein